MSDTQPQTQKDSDSDANAPAGPQADAQAPEVPSSPEELLAREREAFQQQRDSLLRAVAEAENARKRAHAEVSAARKFALERFAENLLPVVDSLEAALAIEGATAEALRSGTELTLRQLRSALEKGSVMDINPAPGERFDPHRHQAMAAVASEAEPNTVVAVLQKGWSIHERVLRPALVTVAKAAEAAAESGTGS